MIDKNMTLSGSFIDSDLHLSDQNTEADVMEESKRVWRNEKVLSVFALTNHSDRVIEAELTTESKVSASQDPELLESEIFKIKKVEAYTGMPGFADRSREIPQGDRKKAEDVLFPVDRLKLFPNETVSFALIITVAKDIAIGAQRVKVLAHNVTDDVSVELTTKLLVLEQTFPDVEQTKELFPLVIWQNPYAVAEHYDVQPFSEDHLMILDDHMDLYKEAGGETITASIVEDAWDGQTYSKNEIKFPSMVKWTKNTAGTFSYDYTDLDKWLTFAKAKGLGQKVIFYSIAPWNGKILYQDEASQEMRELEISPHNDSYDVLEAFLIDLYDHLKTNNWEENVYIGIDERGFDEDLIGIVLKNNEKGTTDFKLSGAVDTFEESKDIIGHFEDITISFSAIDGNRQAFKNLLNDRKTNGLQTFMYSCTRHIPGNFTLSAPGESYWTILKTHALSMDGFLRWAFDSWVEDPLVDTTHNAFEAGDCFLVYPDNKSEEHPVSRSSLRFEKMKEGIRDVIKLKQLSNSNSELSKEIDDALTLFHKEYDSSQYYLSQEGKHSLAKDLTSFRKQLDKWSAAQG